MSATKSTDSLKIKWRGHPTEKRAEGKAPGLRYPVGVHFLHDKANFGIYYGSRLQETLQAPLMEGETKIRDIQLGYEQAKARAQALAESWSAKDALYDAKLEAERNAQAEARMAAAKAETQRKADTAEALKLSAEVEKWSEQGCDAAAANAGVKLAALVKKLLGGE